MLLRVNSSIHFHNNPMRCLQSSLSPVSRSRKVKQFAWGGTSGVYCGRNQFPKTSPANFQGYAAHLCILLLPAVNAGVELPGSLLQDQGSGLISCQKHWLLAGWLPNTAESSLRQRAVSQSSALLWRTSCLCIDVQVFPLPFSFPYFHSSPKHSQINFLPVNLIISKYVSQESEQHYLPA